MHQTTKTINVMDFFFEFLKADLDGTTVAYNCRMRLFSRVHAARIMQTIAHNSRHSTLPISTIVVGFLNMFLNPTTSFVTYTTVVSEL